MSRSFYEDCPGLHAVKRIFAEAIHLLADGRVAGGVYMWKDRASAERFYSGPWRAGIVERYGNAPRIQYFETVALADVASRYAGALSVSGETPVEASAQ